MIRKLILPLILLVMAIVFVWPAPAEYRTAEPKGEPFQGELGIDCSYVRGKNEVYVTLRNSGYETLYFSGFRLERLLDDQWVFRSHTKPASETDAVHTLAPGKSMEILVDVPYFVGRLKVGEYRIYISVFTDSEQTNSAYIYHEFSLE